MSNKFFTIMVVPEKSNRVNKIVIPSYVFKGGILSLAFLVVLAAIMVLDYANVMNQINENKQLKIENRQLRQNVQVFKTKMVAMENTLDRVKTFVTKLRIITNIEDTAMATQSAAPLNPSAVPATPSTLSPAPNPNLPITAPGIILPTGTQRNSTPATPSLDVKPGVPGPKRGANDTDTDAAPVQAGTGDAVAPEPQPEISEAPGSNYEQTRIRRLGLLAALMTESPDSFTLSDADTSLFVKTEFEKLDSAYEEVNKFALATEQETQDILEKLSEKRTMLASTPTRIPTLGYITSEWGIRINPYDNRRKMHEGLDIANRFGADIVAPADGVVTFAGVKPGYGKVVILDHGNGIETLYAHSSRLAAQINQKVKRGQRIAQVGNTGHSTGPHCHYEVHAGGVPVDPCYYILDAACQQRGSHHRAGRVSIRPSEPGSVDPE